MIVGLRPARIAQIYFIPRINLDTYARTESFIFINWFKSSAGRLKPVGRKVNYLIRPNARLTSSIWY